MAMAILWGINPNRKKLRIKAKTLTAVRLNLQFHQPLAWEGDMTDPSIAQNSPSLHHKHQMSLSTLFYQHNMQISSWSSFCLDQSCYQFLYWICHKSDQQHYPGHMKPSVSELPVKKINHNKINSGNKFCYDAN